MGVLRKLWLSFKKDHPKFVEHRRYKKDVGPRLDEIDSIKDEIVKAATKTKALCLDYAVAHNSLHHSLSEYSDIIKEMVRDDKISPIGKAYDRFGGALERDFHTKQHDVYDLLDDSNKALLKVANLYKL